MTLPYLFLFYLNDFKIQFPQLLALKTNWHQKISLKFKSQTQPRLALNQLIFYREPQTKNRNFFSLNLSKNQYHYQFFSYNNGIENLNTKNPFSILSTDNVNQIFLLASKFVYISFLRKTKMKKKFQKTEWQPQDFIMSLFIFNSQCDQQKNGRTRWKQKNNM